MQFFGTPQAKPAPDETCRSACPGAVLPLKPQGQAIGSQSHQLMFRQTIMLVVKVAMGPTSLLDTRSPMCSPRHIRDFANAVGT